MSKQIRRRMSLGAIAATLGLLIALGWVQGRSERAFAAAPEQRMLEFNKDVRLILSDNCFACHGPDSASRKAGLRLDSFEGATAVLKSGGAAVVPGHPERSKLFERITSHDRDRLMPPADSGKSLTEAEIATLKQWIEQGAEYQPHWAFIPPKRPPLPRVNDPAWVRNPIDAFVLANLERNGLAPSPEADKATLLRRVTFDLTGLPPTPEEIDAFLADNSPNAYEKVVDRLLASPRYGEHMTRYWLDAARYGDTHALHLDNERALWRWREWVIKAYNDNMPFDQFTVEQLAGDLLPNPTLSQLIATGFNRNNPTTGEGGAIEAEYRVKYAIDRVDTTATVWLGMTMACAQCHDHKYDPITQKEFYEFFAFFNSVTESGLDGNALAPPPFIKAPTEEQQKQLEDVRQQIARLETRLGAPHPQMDAAQAGWERAMKPKLENLWQVLDPVEYTSTGGSTLTKLDDHSILAEGNNPVNDNYEIVARTNLQNIGAVKLEALTHESLPHRGPGRASNANLVLSEFEMEVAPAAKPDEFKTVRFVSVAADHEQLDGNYLAAKLIDGASGGTNGWAPEGHARHEDRTVTFVPAEPIGYPGGTIMRFRLRHESQFSNHQVGRARLSISNSPAYQPVTMGEWHVLGPFPAATFDEAHKKNFGPEGVKIDVKKPIAGKSWTAKPDFKDGQPHYFQGDNAAVYLYRSLRSPAPRQLTVSVGSDDSIKVWLNGRVVHDNRILRGLAQGSDTITLDLNAGDNQLLIKVANSSGGFAYVFEKKSEESGLVPPAIAAALLATPDARTDADKAAIRDYYRRNFSKPWRELDDQMAALKQQEKAINDAIPVTMIMQDTPTPRDTFVLIRGDYDKHGEKVTPGVPAALPPLPAGMPANRLALAKWLVDPNHPLTARVTVNRYWARYFGEGIVATIEDLGTQGDWPANPELLDWLATEFVRTDWDVKRMQRLMVTSAAYRQSSVITPQLLERDPLNRLVARGARHRMDAEMIRDTALAVSGLLVEKLGGRSYKPYQPSGLWEAVSYTDSNTARFVQDTGDVLYRRSMYIFWKRSSAPPNMTALDAPDREACTVQRNRTNTPLQALVLMNDPQFVEAARVFGKRIMHEGGNDVASRIDWAFRLCTARHPEPDEKAIIEAFYQEQLSRFRQDQQGATRLVSVGDKPRDEAIDVSEHAAWTMVANLLLNMDETVTKH